MADKEAVEALAKELQALALAKDFETLAAKLPTPEAFAQYMESMFVKPDVLKQFDEQVLKQK